MASQFGAEYACMVKMRVMSRIDGGTSIWRAVGTLLDRLTTHHVHGPVDEDMSCGAIPYCLERVDGGRQEPVMTHGSTRPRG